MPRVLTEKSLNELKKFNAIYGGKTVTVTKENKKEVVKYLFMLKDFSRRTATYCYKELTKKVEKLNELSHLKDELDDPMALYSSPKMDTVKGGKKSVRNFANVPERYMRREDAKERVQKAISDIEQSVRDDIEPLINLQDWLEKCFTGLSEENEKQESMKKIMIGSSIYNQTWHELVMNEVLDYIEEPLLVGTPSDEDDDIKHNWVNFSRAVENELVRVKAKVYFPKISEKKFKAFSKVTTTRNCQTGRRIENAHKKITKIDPYYSNGVSAMKLTCGSLETKAMLHFSESWDIYRDNIEFLFDQFELQK